MSRQSALAVVGVDGRFPGADSMDEFWNLLIKSESGISSVSQERWSTGDQEKTWDRGGFIRDPARFDADFFGISPVEAEAMDPQQRIALETVWRAIEDGGVNPKTLAGRRIGVFAGVMGNDWAQISLSDPDAITAQVGTGNGNCIVANRISYCMGLIGPSFAVDSACSSSLLALHLARQAILTGDCEEAIVVGANVMMTSALGHFYAEAGLAAQDGHCKPFSKNATGIVRGEAVVAIHLVPLGTALEQDRPIRAVIHGSAINQDGRSNGLTAPNRFAQADVIRRAIDSAGVDPIDITAVECHGTGTILGDMIEANALGDIYGAERTDPLLIGSVKGNVGHVEGAAGLVGVAKMILALERRLLPPSMFADTENEALRLKSKNLQLMRSAARIRERNPLVGVSSFGLGGTNAHVIIGAAPFRPNRPVSITRSVVATLGAPNEASLERNSSALAEHLASHPGSVPAIVGRSVRRIRSEGRRRLAIVSADQNALESYLRMAASGKSSPEIFKTTRRDSRAAPVIGWIFAGQGSEHKKMSLRLAQESATFQRHYCDISRLINEELGEERLSLDKKGYQWTSTDSALIQAAVFAHEMALALTLRECGLEPTWTGGHSLGEVAAAVIANALDLESAVKLTLIRGALCDSLPATGGMLAVHMPAEKARTYTFPEGIEIAAFNSPTQIVLSGNRNLLELAAASFEAEGTVAKMLGSSRAFHSADVDAILEKFSEMLSELGIDGVPDRPFYSSMLGRFLEPGERLDIGYWVAHLRAPVQFEPLGRNAPTTDLVLEFGPRRTLAGSMRHGMLENTPVWCVTSEEDAGAIDIERSLARAYVEGAEVIWEDSEAQISRIPGYTFNDQERYWRSQPKRGTSNVSEHAQEQVPAELLGDDEDNYLESGRDEETMILRWVLDTVADITGHSREKVLPGSLLAEDLYFDSVMIVQFSALVSEKLGIHMDLAQLLANVSTPGDIAAFIQTHDLANTRLQEFEERSATKAGKR